jgi:hypothetical protein
MVTYMSEKMSNGLDKAMGLTPEQLAKAEELLGDFKENPKSPTEEVERDFIIKQTTAEAVGPTPEQIIVANEKLKGSPLADATIAEGYVAPIKPGDTYGKNFAQPHNRPVASPIPKKSFLDRLFGG